MGCGLDSCGWANGSVINTTVNNYDCVKHGKTLDELSNYEVLKKDFALLSVVMLLVYLITSSVGKIDDLDCSDDWR